MSGNGCRVHVVRGEEQESRHRVDGIVVGMADGGEVLIGEGDLLTFWRSSFKPFQALPLVADGAAARFGLSREALALCCASHGGTPRHLEIVREILERIGRDGSDLACGPAAPLDRDAARQVDREDGAYEPIHNNCSGKHAGMLAMALHGGWPTDGYAGYDHPVQRRIREGLARWLDVDPERLSWAVDGCGVPTPYLSVRQMARAYARLVRSAARSDGPARKVVTAMTEHPILISAAGRLSERLMRVTEGRLLAKEGAEGVLCAAGRDAGWGMALKVRDGSRRALGPAAVAALGELDLLGPEEAKALEEVGRPPVEDTRGEPVGWIEADVRLRRTVPAHPVREGGEP